MKYSAKVITGPAANPHFFLRADVCKLQINRCLSTGIRFFFPDSLHTPHGTSDEGRYQSLLLYKEITSHYEALGEGSLLSLRTQI